MALSKLLEEIRDRSQAIAQRLETESPSSHTYRGLARDLWRLDELRDDLNTQLTQMRLQSSSRYWRVDDGHKPKEFYVLPILFVLLRLRTPQHVEVVKFFMREALMARFNEFDLGPCGSHQGVERWWDVAQRAKREMQTSQYGLLERLDRREVWGLSTEGTHIAEELFEDKELFEFDSSELFMAGERIIPVSHTR